MSIFNSVGESIKRYGSCISIIDGGKRVSTRAFIEPLRYKNRIYIGGEYHKVGFRRSEKYLYIGSPDNILSENSSVIEMKNTKYIVKRCEIYYVNDYPIYVWAILLPYGSPLEDEYESD